MAERIGQFRRPRKRRRPVHRAHFTARQRVISLGEHIFCNPRAGGDPVFNRRFNRLLDSLRGNDERRSVPAFPTQLIPH